MKATAAIEILPGTAGLVNVWQGGINTGEQEVAAYDWDQGSDPIPVDTEIWIKWQPDEQTWVIRKDTRGESSVTTTTQTFIKINQIEVPTPEGCSFVEPYSDCVFWCNLVTYHGDLEDACGPWVQGENVYAVAINQCQAHKVRQGDIFAADLIEPDFFRPVDADPYPLYAFRIPDREDQKFLKIVSTGGDPCSEHTGSNYCHWEAKLVSYHGGEFDACGVWVEGDDVYATVMNRCDTNRVKIGDQFPAWLVFENFDPGGPGSDKRDLYAIRGINQKQTTKIGKIPTGGGAVSPGSSTLVEIWRRPSDLASPAVTTDTEVAWLDWMHNSEPISEGKEVLITWFEDEGVWRITGAECEDV